MFYYKVYDFFVVIYNYLNDYLGEPFKKSFKSIGICHIRSTNWSNPKTWLIINLNPLETWKWISDFFRTIDANHQGWTKNTKGLGNLNFHLN